jgi:hypothetical protein
MGIMPNDRTERLESALRRFGIPGTVQQSDRKKDDSSTDAGQDTPPGSSLDSRRRMLNKKTRSNRGV